MDLFRLLLDPAGAVLEKDKINLTDLTTAMRAPFLGPFHGGSGEAQIPLGDGSVAVLHWVGSTVGTARGTFSVDDEACLETVLVAGRDAAADETALSSFAADFGGQDTFADLAQISQRPLLVGVRHGAWPAGLTGSDILLSAIYLDGLPAAAPLS